MPLAEGSSAATLDAVLQTQALQGRPRREPDYRLESEALTRLSRALAESPQTILEQLCLVAQDVCRAGSAGVSLLNQADHGASFYWRAITGAWTDYVGGGTPRNFGPCGIVLDRNGAQLFVRPDRYYPYLQPAVPRLEEGLLAPFYVGGVAAGTVWVLSHDPARQFDLEDQRLLETLATFAAGAYQAVESIRERTRDQLALSQTMERLQATLSASEVATWVWESGPDRVYADDNLARMFGVSPEDAAGGPIAAYLKFIHPDDRPRVEQAVGAVLAGEPDDYEVEYRLLNEAGETRWVVARGRVQRDAAGQPKRFPGVVIDITARKHAEQVVIDADRRKDEFLAMLAHELRNPLAPIRNGVRLLEEGAQPGTESAVVAMLHRQVDHMVRLIDDLLDVSRVSCGKIELRRARVDLAAVLQQAIEANRPLCDKLGHQLTVSLPDEPVWLDADATRVAQAVGNLLSNACKFTDAGGRVALAVELQGEDAVIRVRDSGIGISAQQLPQIFELFSQADTSLARTESGLGIGLTLARRLVELHGGSIHATSAGLGHGTEVTIRLPRLPTLPAEQPAPAAVPASTARRVLVVDDNRDAADSIAMLLELDGHTLHVAHDGEAALQALRDGFAAEVVLLDIGLPRMDGYEVARRIRSDFGDACPRLIAMTGWGQADDLRRSRDAGFDAHLVKPVGFEELQAVLGR